MRIATATLGADVGRVLELDATGERLTPIATVGMPDALPDAHTLPLSLSDTVGALRPLRTGEPAITEDIAPS